MGKSLINDIVIIEKENDNISIKIPINTRLTYRVSDFLISTVRGLDKYFINIFFILIFKLFTLFIEKNQKLTVIFVRFYYFFIEFL